MTEGREKALVVLSGGQDSTTCLFWAIDCFGRDNVSTISFDYGQRHKIELECAARVAEYADVRNTRLPIDTFNALGGDALTDENIEVESLRTRAKSYLPDFCGRLRVPARYR
jgi:7-cyano-7-deazaguanine synthase